MIEPSITHWKTLNPEQQHELLQRPPVSMADSNQCATIIQKVRDQGDAALIELTLQYDQVSISELQIPPKSLHEAWKNIDQVQRDALQAAYENIKEFHRPQLRSNTYVQTAPGVNCELRYSPIESIGLYIPGGSAPLPSTVLMLGVPSQLAGCPNRVLCTPPQRNGGVDQLILAAAYLCGIEIVFRVGGAQAIAAMAYGTETIPKVDKVYGPGNPWVTRAKQLVAQDAGGAAYDLPAGPSEILIIADKSADANFVAADLLSQAEHGVDSQVILLTDDMKLADAVTGALQHQLALLPRSAIATQALRHCRLIVVNKLDDAFEISNRYAPEHLIINTKNARANLSKIKNAGSVFVGPWAPESVGDYCSGTNHVLPTHGYASRYSGLGIDDFQKRMSVQELDRDGLQNIAWIVESLATSEGLHAHARAVSLRLEPNASTATSKLSS